MLKKNVTKIQFQQITYSIFAFLLNIVFFLNKYKNNFHCISLVHKISSLVAGVDTVSKCLKIVKTLET